MRKIFNRKSSHKNRTDEYWTDSYPSADPSWMKKTINNAGEWIFINIDNFFQGTSTIKNTLQCVENFPYSTKLETNDFEWELDQDIFDIVLCDIKSCFSWVMPGFISKFVFRLYQLTLLYLFTDLDEDELSKEWYEATEVDINRTEQDKTKSIYNLQVIKDIIDVKCLSINDWLELTFCRFKLFLGLEYQPKAYYLLGYFAPQGYDDSKDKKYYKIRRPERVKLKPVFSFHKRI